MEISDLQIEELQRLYKSKFGLDLSPEESRELGADLVQLLRLVYKPITAKDVKSDKNKVERKESSDAAL